MTVKQKILWMVIGGVLAAVLICSSCAPLFVLAAALGGTEMSPSIAAGPAVGIVRVEGVIISGSPPTSPFGSQGGAAYSGAVVNHLRRAEADPDVKAVVMRVVSPGGSVVASDEIHQQMVAMSKPVVVSMGEMAASGGYYVSAPADEIYANPSTLTGSIGVIGQFLDLSELFEEYGIAATIIKSGTYKDEGSFFRPMTDEEKIIWQDMIDEIYEGFVRVVVDGREMPIDEVKTLADGRVYTGQQAKELGLVDELGNLPDVIERAAELGGIEGEPRIVEYYEPLDLFESLFSLMRPADPMADVFSLLERSQGPVLQYLYVGP
ncbi:MAG: signal peptide peptidase SppA [Ardenticatenia bacterium]|nr:signal peptide peptidase SppA [Ardenticatenia bacterium]